MASDDSGAAAGRLRGRAEIQTAGINVPQNFRGDTTGLTNSLGDMPWWELFHDEELQALIRSALINNYDVRIAAARVEQARAILEETGRAIFRKWPTRGRSGTAGTLAGARPFRGPPGKRVQAAGNVSWEIDLWGRIRRMNESARAQFLATKEARTNVLLTLITTVA